MTAAVAGAAVLATAAAADANTVTGPNSSDSPYLFRAENGVVTKSILTAGDTPTGSAYRMVGIPDGLGAYDNGDGTFTVLMNHELSSSVGATRAHGGKGAFVSKWVIDKATLEVRSGEDLIRNLNLTSGGLNLNRLCSADLADPGAFANPASGLGYSAGRIFTSGEETSGGRGFAHVASGPDAGQSYELPRLGKLAFENIVATPSTGNKTVVISTDDTTGGQVYVYVGDKTANGSPVDRAGLTNGNLFGIKAFPTEDATASVADNSTFSFTLAGLGDVSAKSGAQLETDSNAAGITRWARPEDGSWDPANPNDFYFVTTASFTQHSRLWRLRFNDISQPEAGGQVQMLLEGPAGTESGPKMMDNITVDTRGRVLIQEDPGNNAYLAGVYQYDIQSDTVRRVLDHDPNRFVPGGSDFRTIDEESSGIIPLFDILGEGWYLLDSQVHAPYLGTNPGEIVEQGQLLVAHVPPGQKVGSMAKNR